MLPTPSPVLALVSVRRGIPLFTEKALRSKTSGNVMRCLVGWFVMAAILTTQTPIGLYLSAPSGFCCQAPIGCYSSTHRSKQSSDCRKGSTSGSAPRATGQRRCWVNQRAVDVSPGIECMGTDDGATQKATQAVKKLEAHKTRWVLYPAIAKKQSPHGAVQIP